MEEWQAENWSLKLMDVIKVPKKNWKKALWEKKEDQPNLVLIVQA